MVTVRDRFSGISLGVELYKVLNQVFEVVYMYVCFF